MLPGVKSQKFPEAPVGLVYPGDNGLPRSLFFGDKNNFAPRVGIAWDVTGNCRTSVRAGYELFYQIRPVGHSNSARHQSAVRDQRKFDEPMA